MHACMFMKALCRFRFCRLWWKKHPLQIRKLTAISSQRRTSRPQVNLQYRNSLFDCRQKEITPYASESFFSKRLCLHFLSNRNVPCVPHGKGWFFPHYKPCPDKDRDRYESEAIMSSRFIFLLNLNKVKKKKILLLMLFQLWRNWMWAL